MPSCSINGPAPRIAPGAKNCPLTTAPSYFISVNHEISSSQLACVSDLSSSQSRNERLGQRIVFRYSDIDKCPSLFEHNRVQLLQPWRKKLAFKRKLTRHTMLHKNIRAHAVDASVDISS